MGNSDFEFRDDSEGDVLSSRPLHRHPGHHDHCLMSLSLSSVDGRNHDSSKPSMTELRASDVLQLSSRSCKNLNHHDDGGMSLMLVHKR